jgi:hypothetical protein
MHGSRSEDAGRVSPHVPTKITGDPGMVNYAQTRADHGSTVYQIAAGWGTHSYLEREDGQ